MFAATQQQQLNQQPEEQDQLKQHQPPPPLTAEEEALKRNTDCVYFLASPLTCKKGSECEYRHSEYARVNPRDCYYWLNGNCLNPKCGFRHPPLDGLLGTQVAAVPAGPVIASHTAAPVTAHAPYGSSAPSSSGKPAVPCIFFQKGYCLKGDRCAFLHGPVPTGNKVPQAATAPNPVTGPPALKKTFGVLEKSTQQQKIPLTHEPRAAPKVETVPPRNGVGAKRYAPTHTGLNDEGPRYKPTHIPPAVNGSSLVHANLSHQAYAPVEQSYNYAVKDTDEHLRESSPGFDVLVDDELGASEYYPGENQYGRARGQEGRNGNEYDLGCSANYDAPADVDREMFRDTRGYDSYDRMQGKYDLDQRRSSVGSGHMERRGYSKPESPERIGESDLRYRLSKHRRVNGLRSVVTHDHAPENHAEERSYRGSSRRDSHRLPQHESSLSSRLRGRIKLPGRSPVNDSTDSRSEMERGRSRGRLSPTRPPISGRLRERIKGRAEEEFNSNPPRMRREITDDVRPHFAGPKRLSELKVADNKEHLGLRKRKALEDHHNHHQSEGNDLSFDGPMPLCEILKRKKQAKTEASDKEDANQKTTRNIPVITQAVETEEKPEDTEVALARSESSQQVLSDHEVEDGMIVEEGEKVPELEGEEQKEEYGEEEYYYEQGDEGEYNYEEDGENVEPEEEYLEEDEDGDDFAKKIGVVLS